MDASLAAFVQTPCGPSHWHSAKPRPTTSRPQRAEGCRAGGQAAPCNPGSAGHAMGLTRCPHCGGVWKGRSTWKGATGLLFCLSLTSLTVSSLNAKRRLAWCLHLLVKDSKLPVGGLLNQLCWRGQALVLALAGVPETSWFTGLPGSRGDSISPWGNPPRMQRRE